MEHSQEIHSQNVAPLTLEFWEVLKSHLLSKNPNNKTLESWLAPVKAQKIVEKPQGPCLVLEVPSDFYRYHILENLMDSIYIEARAINPDILIDVVVNKSEDNGYQNLVNLPHEEIPTSSSSIQIGDHLSPSYRRADFLDPNFTFSNFVVGRNSEFAHAACYNVARNPGSGGYNPLLICGPVGMGKTHLLHAVGHEILSHSPHTRIVYMQAERFLNEFIVAMRNKKTESFRHKYRDQVDVLLFDDIQFIGKGEATQEEFFHIFNSLIEKKKQIILASDRRPKDILKLEDRNRSRLEWGLTVDITMPDVETRMAILRYKAEQMQIKLSDDVVAYIAKVAKRSIREIEGALKTLKMFSELQGVPIDIQLTKRILISQESQNSLSIDDILKLVSDHFKISINDLKSSSRAKPIVIPRQIAMYLIKKHLNKSFVEIGRHFGNRDHTTVMNAIEKVQYLQATDANIRNDIEDLTNQIHNITGL
ncbi:MAG: chromosomal replication initiator protein DnaA [Bdellovibrionaceae bacterium]|nr:chromosomal replication initiator protein DnaA [Pseudobdellovibrionaceae bacterium]MDW8189345.1 chromosomal replication initiator protein DnaA [Pseudobdellovibrionaceae bacterium]